MKNSTIQSFDIETLFCVIVYMTYWLVHMVHRSRIVSDVRDSFSVFGSAWVFFLGIRRVANATEDLRLISQPQSIAEVGSVSSNYASWQSTWVWATCPKCYAIAGGCTRSILIAIPFTCPNLYTTRAKTRCEKLKFLQEFKKTVNVLW